MFCSLRRGLKGECCCTTVIVMMNALLYSQTDLRRVLKAYAMYNKKTGYCQVVESVAVCYCASISLSRLWLPWLLHY